MLQLILKRKENTVKKRRNKIILYLYYKRYVIFAEKES